MSTPSVSPLTFPGPTALATWTNPEGGFFRWVTFNNAIDTSNCSRLQLPRRSLHPGSRLLGFRKFRQCTSLRIANPRKD